MARRVPAPHDRAQAYDGSRLGLLEIQHLGTAHSTENSMLF